MSGSRRLGLAADRVTLLVMDEAAARRAVLGYHRRSEHTAGGYARSLGYLDWASQPDPFRRYLGCRLTPLEHPGPADSPLWSALRHPRSLACCEVSSGSISRFLYDSLSLSAWKQAGDSRWSLRVNPSSGNLHPTESYLICPPVEGICVGPALLHYDPSGHALEQRRLLAAGVWESLGAGQDGILFLVGLTSIYWREAWKYGERAFRYCQLDVGHALGCLAVSAAALGWNSRLVEPLPTEMLERLLGTSGLTGPEAEHAECLVAIRAGRPEPLPADRSLSIRTQAVPIFPDDLVGTPNELSSRHVEWPVIDEIAAATEQFPGPASRFPEVSGGEPEAPGDGTTTQARAGWTVRSLVRQRRSALAMDGVTSLPRNGFLEILNRCAPAGGHPANRQLPWNPVVSMACFVHRVEDLEPGLYLLLRERDGLETYRRRLDPAFLWEKVGGSDDDLGLYLLRSGDYREKARLAACGQEIASDGVASFAMIGDLPSHIERYGAWFYRRLFWEAGLLGQILYLEAEAAGVRGTGIGCFFDDLTRNLLGVRERGLECFYHFTLGGAVDDPRLQSLPAYGHLSE